MKPANLFVLACALVSSLSTVPVLAGQMGPGGMGPDMGRKMSGMSGMSSMMDGMMDKMMGGMSMPDKKQMKTQKPQMKKMIGAMKPADRTKMMDEMMAMPPGKRMAAMQKMTKHHGMGSMKAIPTGKTTKKSKRMGGPPMSGGGMGDDM